MPEGGTLYVVSTPIGNLGDITLRAIEVLRSVAVVAAEDTRHTRRLWARHDISTPLVSFHAHSPDRRRDELLARLRGGEDVALVTDAGTPLVSDPGDALVSAWAGEDGPIVPIPGASAVLAAVVASGLAGSRWGFEGFLPRKGRERRARLERLATDDRATILFEAPGRTAATLRDLASACGEGRAAAVCRELTKRHEEVLRGSLGELAASVGSRTLKGEVAIVVAGAASGPSGEGRVEVAGSAGRGTAGAGSGPAGAGGGPAGRGGGKAVTLEEGRASVDALVAGGLSRSAAAKEVASRTGLPRRELFDRGR